MTGTVFGTAVLSKERFGNTDVVFTIQTATLNIVISSAGS